MNKALLFVGGGLEAVPGIQLAKNMGHITVVSDLDMNAPGCVEADYTIEASTYDIKTTLAKAIEFNDKIVGISGVMSVASDIPLTVATIAQELKLPGISIHSAELASDKLAMKKQFAMDGIPIPWFTEIFHSDELRTIIKDRNNPIVIKPVDSRGARGVLKVSREMDLDWAFNESQKNSPSGRVMVEEFITGPQISTESIVLRGETFTIGFSDRNYEYLDHYAPHIIENGGDLPSQIPIEQQNAVHQLIHNAAHSLGINSGIVKGDIVIKDGIPYVIEIAARLSGGYFCTHEIPLNTGVDFVGQAIRLALGEEINPKKLTPKFNHPVSQRYLFPKAGRVEAILGVENVVRRSSVKLCEIRVKVGDYVQPVNNHPGRAGVIITQANTQEIAIKEAIRAVNDIQIVTK
jgi:biotin carboxylase